MAHWFPFHRPVVAAEVGGVGGVRGGGEWGGWERDLQLALIFQFTDHIRNTMIVHLCSLFQSPSPHQL